jgi:hypothetical protein
MLALLLLPLLQDELPAIFSFCQRLGLAPTPEWLAATTSAAMSQLLNRERMMRAAEFRRLIVGLAGLGWRPSQEQLDLIVNRSYPQLQSTYFQVWFRVRCCAVHEQLCMSSCVRHPCSTAPYLRAALTAAGVG